MAERVRGDPQEALATLERMDKALKEAKDYYAAANTVQADIAARVREAIAVLRPLQAHKEGLEAQVAALTGRLHELEAAVTRQRDETTRQVEAQRQHLTERLAALNAEQQRLEEEGQARLAALQQQQNEAQGALQAQVRHLERDKETALVDHNAFLERLAKEREDAQAALQEARQHLDDVRRIVGRAQP